MARHGYLIAVFGLLAVPQATLADVISNYTIFAISGDTTPSGPEAGQLYGYTTLGATPTFLGNVPGDGSPTPGYGFGNGLATDTYRNRLVYIRNSTAGDAGRTLWEYSLTTNTFRTLGLVGTTGTNGISVSSTSGGGTFYQGSYYYWDDTGGNNSEGLIRVDFDANGDISTQTTITRTTNRGGFGDIAISSSGIMYGVSLAADNESTYRLWSINLNTHTVGDNTPTIVTYTVSGGGSGNDAPLFQQIAFDNAGNLIGVERETAATENWYTVTFGAGNTYSATATTRPGFGAAAFDLSSGGLYPVPEPAAFLLAGAGMGGLFWWRRRRKQRAVCDCLSALS